MKQNLWSPFYYLAEIRDKNLDFAGNIGENVDFAGIIGENVDLVGIIAWIRLKCEGWRFSKDLSQKVQWSKIYEGLIWRTAL